MLGATRSRICEGFVCHSNRKLASSCFHGHFAAEDLRECDDLFNSSFHDSDLVDENPVRIGSASGLKTRLRPSKGTPDMFKNFHTTQVSSPDDSQPQTTRIRGPGDSGGGVEIQPGPVDASKSSDSEQTAKFGMYAGRVKANPLKYLATLLRSKLELQHDHATCNLLDIATEIHDEAKNKHNTTLRRIYDVVNVLEAAGLLERSNGHVSSKRIRESACESSAGRSTLITSEYLDSDPGTEEELAGLPKRDIQASKADLGVDKRTARGSNIRWIRSQSEREARFWKQANDERQIEKKDAAERISKKCYELEILQEELRLTTELINHNRSHNRYVHDGFESHVTPCTPPPAEDHNCYLNLDESPSQTSGTESGQESDTAQANTTSENTELKNYQSMSQEDLAHWYLAMDENEINSLERNCDLSSTPFTHSGALVNGLRIPFVILQTHNSTNVDIELDGNETNAVYIGLDNDFKLFDYKELLSSMFPKSSDMPADPRKLGVSSVVTCL